jgi:hypothetical protein
MQHAMHPEMERYLNEFAKTETYAKMKAGFERHAREQAAAKFASEADARKAMRK